MEKKAGQTSLKYSRSKCQKHSQDLNKSFKEQSLYLSPTKTPIVKFASKKLQFEEELTDNTKNIYIDPTESDYQKHSINIIKDTQSYQFLSETKQLDLILPEEEQSNHSVQSFYNEFLESMMISAIDPKSFESKSHLPEFYSTINLSPSASEPLQSEIIEHADICKKEEFSSKHSPITPVVAFCSTCETNIRTEVIENMYPGSL